LAVDRRTRQQIQDIRRVLKRSRAPEDLTVYRVVPADVPVNDRAFLSTTTDPAFARQFQKRFGGRPTRILKINVAAGTSALFINNTFEREVLLDGTDRHPTEVWEEPQPAVAAVS
jgi:ADP-ribosyltransferase exoenzyme